MNTDSQINIAQKPTNLQEAEFEAKNKAVTALQLAKHQEQLKLANGATWVQVNHRTLVLKHTSLFKKH